jgi:4a-hydroxytetrahydrobiopterin dehydratase
LLPAGAREVPAECENTVMPKLPLLTSDECAEALQQTPDWVIREEKLYREYRFPDFIHAFGFMAASAVAIEAMNHHPEWSNVYNRVTVKLSTHDSGGITSRDFELAAKLESIAKRLL